MQAVPPKFLLRFFRWFCHPELHAFIEGDLLELYRERAERSGKRKANVRFAIDVLLLFRPGVVRPLKPGYQSNANAMFRHNLLISFRNFERYRGSFLINLTGLSTGLACALFILLWVRDELNVDKFHEKDSRLYQVMLNFDTSNGTLTSDKTPVPLAEELTKVMPEVEYAVAVNDFFSWSSREGILSYGDKHIEAGGWHVDENFFHVFSYNLIRGNKERVLADRNSIVLSQRLAKKIFGTTEGVIGSNLAWSHASFEDVFQVSGIFENVPANSTAQFDFLISIDVLTENDRWAGKWTGNYAETYLILKNDTDFTAFNQKISDFLRSRFPLETEVFSLFAQQYSDKYLFGQYENGVPAGGRIFYVRLFSIIALVILLIACINFINLSTAQASRKMKEIGVKRALGANRKVLRAQFLAESMLIVLIALIIALFLVAALLPQFNQITGKQLSFGLDIHLSLALFATFIFTAFVSGIYPAVYLAGFSPLTVLKGKLHKSPGEVWIRKGLVIFQFILSVTFIVGLLVVNRQVEFTQNKNMGYDRDNIISFQWKSHLYTPWNGLREGKSNETFYTFMQEIKNIPGVVNATNMTGNVLDNIVKQSDIAWSEEESDRDFLFESPVVGYDFLETLGIELYQGRSFSKEHHDDYSKIIVNEAAVRHMKLENPVGQVIKMNGGSEIIGVVRDFHYGSLHHQIQPLIFRFEPHGRNVLIRIEAGAEKTTIEKIKAVYGKFVPGYNFNYSFLDEDYQALYASEQKMALLSGYFTAIAIIISCLGLFGLAAFTAQRRKKEIGIRKVLGSGISNIVLMLSADFSKMVLTAIVIALPLSYALAGLWLNDFAYRIDLKWWFFAVSGFAALLMAWAVVVWQTLKVARINPVDSLRNE